MQNNQESFLTHQLGEIWAIVVHQWRVVAMFDAAVVFVTLVGSLAATKQYTAKTRIHISPITGQEVRVDQVYNTDQNQMRNTRQFFRTQIEIIQSRPIREKVSERFAALGYEDGPAASELKAMIQLVPVRSSELIDLYVTAADADQAAALANLVVEVYSEHNLESRQASARNAKVWLDEKLGEYSDRIVSTNKELLDYQTANDLADAEQGLTDLTARMRALNEKLGEITTDRVLLETTVGSHERLLRSRQYADLTKDMATPLVISLTEDYAEAVTENAKIASRYGEKHPERMYSESRLKRIQDELDREVEATLSAERVQLQLLRQKEDGLNASITGAKTELLQRQTLLADFEGLNLKLQRAKGFYESLSSRKDELDLASRTQLNNVQVIESANPPGGASKPDVPFNMLLGLATGLLGGAGLAFLRHNLDDTIGSPWDVSHYLNVNYLGMIPQIAQTLDARGRALYTHHHPKSSAAEALRAIRTLLELNPEASRLTRLMVTSSVASEGKTETSVRLGVSFANLGRRVLIIDADLRKPRLHKIFDEKKEGGLADILMGRATLEDGVRGTSVPRVDLLPAGPIVERPNELLASPAFEATLQEIEKSYDLIILDTPPAGILSDALVMSKHVDGVMIVVRDSTVSRRMVKDSMGRLQQVGSTILGVVVNAVSPGRHGGRYKYYGYSYGYGYGYGYGYQYGKYGPDEDEPEDAAAK